jgi:hypothetical protein
VCTRHQRGITYGDYSSDELTSSSTLSIGRRAAIGIRSTCKRLPKPCASRLFAQVSSMYVRRRAGAVCRHSSRSPSCRLNFEIAAGEKAMQMQYAGRPTKSSRRSPLCIRHDDDQHRCSYSFQPVVPIADRRRRRRRRRRRCRRVPRSHGHRAAPQRRPADSGHPHARQRACPPRPRHSAALDVQDTRPTDIVIIVAVVVAVVVGVVVGVIISVVISVVGVVVGGIDEQRSRRPLLGAGQRRHDMLRMRRPIHAHPPPPPLPHLRAHLLRTLLLALHRRPPLGAHPASNRVAIDVGVLVRVLVRVFGGGGRWRLAARLRLLHGCRRPIPACRRPRAHYAACRRSRFGAAIGISRSSDGPLESATVAGFDHFISNIVVPSSTPGGGSCD